MHLNNKKFGDGRKALNKNIYMQSGDFPISKPPVGSFNLITDSGYKMITDAENYLVTD